MGDRTSIEWTDSTWTPIRARSRATGKVLTLEMLRKRLSYDLSAGEFVWQKARADRVGRVAGKLERHGYVQIVIDGKAYMAHRLAWLWQTGGWPIEEIDHINGRKSDNRWINLRAATRSQNCANKLLKAGASGVAGVSAHGCRWRAQINIAGRRRLLGIFETIEEAASAYQGARASVYGDFAR